jgi:histidinol-phosphate/aromatic aminotransferase/cobyric acid decarboxylase-like protein
MRFPLGDWIDDHADCRYHLGQSGMRGVIAPPTPSRRAVRDASDAELRRRLARLVGVDPSRLFLTHGATEANALVCWFVSKHVGANAAKCRVEYPEYPPLFDGAREAGFRVTSDRNARADLAVVSQPRNPSGDLWTRERLARFARGARGLLVDETFREFTSAPSVQRWDLPGLWTTGTFTKVYGGDDLRVGYLVAPERDQGSFAKFHGVVTDEIAPYSVASALATLDARPRLLRVVRGLMARNRAVWRRARPDSPVLAGPTAFDAPVVPDGDAFARRCLRASVLVCPGSFFGDRSGVRVCLTRRTFARDLARYLAVRAAAHAAGPV